MTVLNKSILFDRFCKNRDVKMRAESGMAAIMKHNAFSEKMLGHQLVRNGDQLFQGMP